MKCKICDRECSNMISLSHHILIHNLSLLDYYIKYEGFEIPKCPICNNNSSLRKGIIFNNTCCDKECISEYAKNRKHSDETKKIMSINRKIYLENNPDKHPWKNVNKFKSKPCEHLKNIIKENDINFIEEYSIEGRFYSIDIAFPDKKIGIEVNGQQHYNSDGSLKDYYKKRDDFFTENGWKLYSVYYIKAYDKKFINELINKLKNDNIGNIDYSFYIKQKKENYCECGKKILNTSKKCNKCLGKERQKERPSKEKLKDDIEKLGFAGSGKKYGVSSTSIRRWLKSYNNL